LLSPFTSNALTSLLSVRFGEQRTMKQTSTMMKAVFLVAPILMLVVPEVTLAVSVKVVSSGGTNGPWVWTVSDTKGNLLGNPQNVCLNATAPSSCTAGAVPPPTLYGYALPAWTADLSSIPGATWIWAPNITGTTSPSANAEFTFQTVFFLCGTPTDGTIFLAADNSAEVFLNGVSVANSMDPNTITGPVTVPASMIAQGLNIIEIKAKNGDNPSDCGSDQYQCNPAGIVFGASFADALPVWPTCTDNGKTFNVGNVEPLMCSNPKQIGSPSRTCICIGGNGFWGPTNGTCMDPPTCTGNNGKAFNVGDVESLSCTTGRIATPPTSHKCLASGSWDMPLGACVVPPPQPPPPATCTGSNGKIFKVGDVESLSCPTGQVSSAPTSHKCQMNGAWDVPLGTCVLPPVGADDQCGDRTKTPPVFATCPSGKTCGPRRTWEEEPGTGKWVPHLDTVEWYCDDWNYALGQSCYFPEQCVSGMCDIGWGTSNTRICVPKTGTGNINDWCSNNNQCASGRCGGLHGDISGAWHPGHCSTGKSALGEFCSTHPDCTSSYCDLGNGTSKTSLCMPQGGTGKTGDPCSNNIQCSNRVCVGLHANADGSWQPGNCN
jgi:hypothetical protein